MQVLRTLTQELGGDGHMITFKQLVKALEGDDSPEDDDMQASQTMSVAASGRVAMPKRAAPRGGRGSGAAGSTGRSQRSARFADGGDEVGGIGGGGTGVADTFGGTGGRMPPASIALRNAESSYMLTSSLGTQRSQPTALPSAVTGAGALQHRAQLVQSSQASGQSHGHEANACSAEGELAVELSLPEGTSMVQPEQRSGSAQHGAAPVLGGMVMHGNDMFGDSGAVSDSESYAVGPGMIFFFCGARVQLQVEGQQAQHRAITTFVMTPSCHCWIALM